MGSEGEWEDGPPDAEPVQEESEEVYEEEVEPEVEIEEIEPEEAPSPPAPSARADRSVFATLSGLGFFVVVLLLLFTVLPAGLGVLGLTILGMAIGTAIPYLWMVDDLRVRPRRLRRSHARFLAGPLIGVLAIVFYGLFVLASSSWILLLWTIGVVAITASSVALFLYSMLWGE